MDEWTAEPTLPEREDGASPLQVFSECLLCVGIVLGTEEVDSYCLC